MSNSILAASTNRCLLTVGRQLVRKGGNDDQISYKNLTRLTSHRPMGVVFGECQT